MMSDLEKKAYMKQLESLQKKMAEMISSGESEEEPESESECAEMEESTEEMPEMKMAEKESMGSEDGEMSPEEIKEYLAKDKKKPMKKAGSLTIAVAMKPKK